MTGLELDAAYEYINWYMSGWVGAYLNRQGYYSAVLDTAKANMKPEEWAYWMDGKPAAIDIMSPEGKLMEKGRRGPRRRRILRAHGACGLLELGDGREPLHGPEMERVRGGLNRQIRVSWTVDVILAKLSRPRGGLLRTSGVARLSLFGIGRARRGGAGVGRRSS